jgi:uncharacterized protein YndB with AHSA1/START domain
MSRLVIKQKFKADRPAVFAALTEADKMSLWFHTDEAGHVIRDERLRSGCHFSFESMNHDPQAAVRGKYLGIVKDERLVFSCSSGRFPMVTQVTIMLLDAPGETELVLTHQIPEEHGEAYRGEWLQRFEHLQALLYQPSGSSFMPALEAAAPTAGA